MQFTKNPANFSDTEKLLYLILQEFKSLNESLTKSEPKPEPMLPVRNVTEVKPKSSLNEDIITCKKCGEKFDNRGLFLRHMKQHKREGS